MFVFLLLVGCFNPVQLIESSGDSIIESSIVEKQILINVEASGYRSRRYELMWPSPPTNVGKFKKNNNKVICVEQKISNLYQIL